MSMNFAWPFYTSRILLHIASIHIASTTWLVFPVNNHPNELESIINFMMHCYEFAYHNFIEITQIQCSVLLGLVQEKWSHQYLILFLEALTWKVLQRFEMIFLSMDLLLHFWGQCWLRVLELLWRSWKPFEDFFQTSETFHRECTFGRKSSWTSYLKSNRAIHLTI